MKTKTNKTKGKDILNNWPVFLAKLCLFLLWLVPSAGSVYAKEEASDVAEPSNQEESLVVVDEAVRGWQGLTDQLPGRVLVLRQGRDAIREITERLRQEKNLRRLSLVTEGRAAAVQFSSGSLSPANLAQHEASLRQWKHAFAPGADFLLYGCDIAQGAQGGHFVKTLAAMTGLDTAASSTPTGPAALGGDVFLEVRHGSIQGADAALEAGLSRLPAVLGYNDMPSVSNPGAQSTNEDTPFIFGSTIVVNEPGSDRMEVVVKINSGNAALSDGEISDTELASQGSRAGLNTFLSTLAFVPAANWNGTAQLQVTVTSDFNNRTAGNTTSFNFNMTVLPVNDAPVASGASSLPAVDEDATPAGATVSSLFSARFDDATDTVSGGSSAHTLAGVAVVGNTVNAGQGQWQYYNGSTWTNVGTRTASSTLLLPVGDSLRFLPAANWFGTPAGLTVRLIDSSSGAVTRGAGPDLSNAANYGGTRVYSAATVALSTSVNPVNDAPITTDHDINATKNLAATFSLASSEVDTGSNTTTDAIVTGYRVVTVPANGTLRTSNNVVISAPNTDISVAQATNMTFTPDTNYVGASSFTFRAIDAATTQSGTTTVTINVQPFNEPPVVSVTGPATVNEDTSLSVVGTASVADPDAGTAIIRATVAATHGTVTLAQLTGLTDAASGGAAIGTATFSSLTFYGTMANINAALTGLRFTPSANYFGAATVSITANDLGNTGSPAKQDSKSIDITVNNVPDAPVTGSGTLAAVNEDTLAPSGATVASLLGGYADDDGDSLAGVAVSGNSADAVNHGRWQYSVNNGMSWSNIGTVSPASALLINSAAKLRFLPVLNYYGTPAPLTVHAVDASGGRVFTTHPNTRQTLNVTTPAGDFDSTGGLVSTSVTSVNDVFTVVNDYPLLVDEGGTSVLTSSRLLISDVEAGAADIVYTVRAAGTNLSEGAFQLDTTGAGAWAPLAADSTFTQSQVNAGRLRYVHNGNEPAAAQTLAYSVTDQLPGAGGTTQNRVLNILVTPVNDAPQLYVPGQTPPGDVVALNGNVAFDSLMTFSTSNLRVVDSDNLDVQLILRIESLPAHGALRFNTAPVAVGSVFSYADLGLFTYRHDGTASVADSFTVSLRDGAGGIVGAAGGTPATPVTVALTIVPYNNPPTVVDAETQILERDQNAAFSFVVGDVESAVDDLVVKILSLPPSGDAVLRFNGTTITQAMVDAPGGFTFRGDQLALLRVNHVSANRVTPPNFSFNISVTDDGIIPATTNATIDVVVRAVDDDPTLDVADIALPAAGATHVLSDENLAGEDVDTPASTLLFRVTVRPVNGSLRLNGTPLGVGGTFTQADVDAGRVTYRHNGRANISDSFQVTLRDQGYNIRHNRPGGVYPDTVSTTLLAHTVNISIPAGGSNPGSGGSSGDVGEGGIYPAIAEIDYVETDKNITLVTHQNELLANDGGITPFNITSVQMKAGFEADGSVSFNNTTKEVTFIPTLNFSGETRYVYTMQDALGRSASADVVVTVFYVNYPPAIATNQPLTLAEGAEAAITTAELDSDDIDDTDESLVYTLLSLPGNGKIYLDSTPGDSVADALELFSGDTFTQADINGGLVKFAHDSHEIFGATFSFRVTDGASPAVPAAPAVATFTIDATPVNDRPRIAVEDFILLENGSFVLTPAQLASSDVDGVGSDKEGDGFATINTLTFSMAEAGHLPAHGTLQRYNGSTWVDLTLGDDFTPAELTAGEIRYRHDGTENFADSITITLDDNTAEPNATAGATIQIGIVPVNDDPVVVKNEILSLDEAATATITFAGHLAGLDPDNTDTQLQFRLTTHTQFGTLWRDGTEALGVGSKFTQQEVKDGRISYQHDGSEATTDSFNFTLSDGGGGNEPADIFRILIHSVNDAPLVTLPVPSIYAVESDETDVRGIVISDPDSVHPVTQEIDPGFGPVDMVLTISVNGGVLDVRQDLALVVGDGTDMVTIQGLMAQINATLASLTYSAGPVAAATGSDVMTIQISDQGNTGAGGPLADTKMLDIIMLGVNTAPVVSVPAAQSVTEDTALVFSTGNGNAVSFSDHDISTGSATATLSVSHGTLTLGSVAGLGSVSGNGTANVSLTGTQAAINTALNGLGYRGVQDYHGADLLTVTVNDLGNSGTFGGALSDTETVGITITPVNDVPTVAGLDYDVDEDGVLTFSLAGSEADTGTDLEDDAVVTHYYIHVRADAAPTTAGLLGQLRTSDNVLLGAANSVTPPGFATLPAGQHVITAAQAADMTYTPPQHFNSDVAHTGADWRSRFEFRAIDILGADYASTSKSDVAEVSVTVDAVNDAAVLAGGGDTVSYTEGSGFDLMGSAVVLNAAADLTMNDVELTAQAEDDFNGATLTVRRAFYSVDTDRYLLAENDGISLSGANVVIGGTTRAVITNNSSSGVLVITFNANASQAHVQTIMRNVAFASVANDLHGDILASMVFNDGNDGGQGSGGPLNSNVIGFTISVQNVNDAPAFTANGLITVAEDTAAPAGTSVNTIMGAFYSDPDPVVLAAGQFSGIAITGDASNQATQGRWQYSVNGTDWHDVTPLVVPADHASATHALLLNKDSLLRFIPVANFNFRHMQANAPAGALSIVAVDASGSRTWTTNAVKQFADTVTGWNDISDLGSDSPALVNANVTQVNDQPAIVSLDDDSTFTEAVGLNVAGPAVLLDDPLSGPAGMTDIDLTLREETSFNGARLFVRARSADPYDLFLPQVSGGISLSGAFTNPGPGVVLFNNGSLIRYNSVTIGTLTDNSSVSGQLVVTFNSNASKAAVDSILQNLTYSNRNPALKNLPPKSIDITFYDGNGSAGNSQGTGGELSTTVTVNMNLLPRNDSPTFTQGTTRITSEDVATTSATFSSLLASYFQDPDQLAVPAENSLDGVAVSAFNNAGLGQWQVSLNGTDWVSLSTINGSVAGGIAPARALLLSAGSHLRFVPNANANTAGSVTKPSLAVHAVEASIPSGAVNGGAGQAAGPITFSSDFGAPATYDTTAHPLESRVGGEYVTIDTQVNSQNDAPAFAAATVWSGTLIESPENNIGTTPPQQLLTGVVISDVDPATTSPLSASVFGAGSITVAITGGVTGDRFFVNGSPAGIASQSGGSNGTNLVVNLATTATFSQVNAILEAIRFEHTTDNPPEATRGYTITLNDGNNVNAAAANAGGPAALAAQVTGDITIIQLNDPPIVTATALNPNFVENSAAPAFHNGSGNIYSSAAVNATGTGQLIREIRYTVTNIEDGSKEFLRVDGYLVALTHGNTLTANYINMGSGFSGTITVSVTGSTATVSYVKAAGLTQTQSQTLINGLRYHSTLDAFTSTTRVVSVVYMQDNGGTTSGGVDTTTDFATAPSNVAASTVTIQPRNDAPVIAATLVNPTTTEQAGTETGTSTVQLFSGATTADVDFTNASFGGGRVVVNMSVYVSGDRLFIPNDTALGVNAVRVSGSNVQVGLDGSAWTTIGTIHATNNGQDTELNINLNAAANEENLGHVLNAIRYRSTSDNPTLYGAHKDRVYALVITDGNNNSLAGGPTELASNTLSGGLITLSTENDNALADLNGASAGLDTAVTWTEVANGTHTSVTVASGTLVTDPDNTKLISLSITAAGLQDGDAEVLRIGGTDFPLGTSEAGVDVGSFVVAYNAATGVFTIVPDDSDPAALASFQTLLRGITYNNTTDDPTSGARLFTVLPTDAGPDDIGVDGLDGTASTFTVNVVPNNDQPVIGGLTPAVFMENAINAAAETIDAAITLTDIDSPSYGGGSLTVSGLVSGQDIVSLPTSALEAAGSVRIAGGNVEHHDGGGWNVVGTHAGGNGTNFVVSFNASADRGVAQDVIQALTFANTSDNPTLTRVLTYTVNDGGANPPLPSTIGVTIRLENDSPVLAASSLGATYTEGGSPAAFVGGTISVTDTDLPANFYNSGSSIGGLTVSLVDYYPDDLLTVAHTGSGAGQIGVSGATISHAGTAFATISGGDEAALVITFTSNAATPSAVRALLAALRFSNTGDDPTVKGVEPTRGFEVVFNDGANTKDAASITTALTAALSGTINLVDQNDIPELDLDGDNSSGALAADYRTVFVTGGAATALADMDSSLTDKDHSELQSLTLLLTNAPDAAQETLSLAAPLPAGITTAGYNPATRTLVLTGPASPADFNTALQMVHYSNLDAAPTLGDRLIEVVANDGVSDSNVAVSTVRVIDVTITNTTPVNEGSAHAFFTVEATSGEHLTLTLGNTAGLTDQDATIAGFTVQYKIGAGSWTNYTWNGTTGNRPLVPGTMGAAGTVLVRVGIASESDTDYEGEETFTLTASASTGGRSATAESAILDDGTGVVHNTDGTVNAGAVQDDDRLLSVTGVTVNEGSPYAVFTVSGADGQKAALSITNETTTGLAAIQYLLAGVWTDYTGGTLVTLPGGTLLVRVALAPEQEQAVDHGETFKLVATNTGGTPSSGGTGIIHDDATGDYFLAANLTSTPNAGQVLDDDRPVTLTSLTVNEGSPYAVFTATGVSGQLVTLSINNVTTTGLSTIQYLSGSTWTSYTSGLLAFPDATMLLRVALAPEQEALFDNGEIFHLVATNTGGGASTGGVGTIKDDETGDYYLPGNTTSTPDAGQILDDDRPVVLQWANSGANPAFGLLDTTIIPNTTTTPVIYPGTNDGRFDVQLTTYGLSGNGLSMMGGEVCWYINGYNSTIHSRIGMRFYRPGTTDPKHVSNIHFSIEDAEAFEELSSFSYYDAVGNKVSVPWNNTTIFKYSHAPLYGSGGTTVENRATLQSKAQSGKWIRVNLSGIAVTGFEFGYRRRSSDAGSIMLSHPAGNPGALGFAGNFSPITLNTGANGTAAIPDYRTQTTRTAGVTGTITQTPAPGTGLGIGMHYVTLQLTTTDSQTAKLGFDLVVIDMTPPSISPPAGGFPQLTSMQAFPDYSTIAVITDNVGIAKVVQQPPPGTVVNTGVNKLTLTATDTNGNISTQTFDITAAPSTESGAVNHSSVVASGADASLHGMPAGYLFSTFGLPAINDAGAVAFMATCRKGGAVMSGIFAGVHPQLIAASGQAAPGVPGAKFVSFYDPCINQAEDEDASVAFLAKISTGMVGLWTNISGELELVALKNLTDAGCGGALIRDISSINFAEGEIVFSSTISAPATTANNQGVWTWNAQDGLNLLLRKGQQVSCAFGKPKIVSRIDMLGAVPGSPGQGRHHPSAGIYLARVACTDGTLINMMTDGEGGMAPMAQNGMPLVSGLKPLSIGIPAGNMPGNVAFQQVFAVVKGNGVTATNNAGILAYGAEGWHLAARKGSAIQGRNGCVWTALGDPVLNNAGSLAWTGTVKPSTSAAVPVIGYCAPGCASALVAERGGQAPGVPGASFAAFTSMALPGGMGPLFIGSLQPKPGVVTATDDTGVWAMDSTGQLRLLLREGQTIGTKKARAFALLISTPGSLGQTRSFNNNRQVVTRLLFTDNTQALMLSEVP